MATPVVAPIRRATATTGEPEGDGELGAGAARQPVGRRTAGDQAADHRQQAQAAAEGVCAGHALEVLRHGEDQPEHGERDRRDQDRPPGEARRVEQAEVEQRLAVAADGAPLPQDERDQDEQAGEQGKQRRDAAPALLACLDRAEVTPARPRLEMTTPAGSRRGALEARDSGMNTATAISASTTAGTLMRNTEPHQKWVSSQPPTMGPIGKASMTMPMSTVSARARSRSEKRTGSTEKESGMMNAAPRPSTVRAAMRTPADGA